MQRAQQVAAVERRYRTIFLQFMGFKDNTVYADDTVFSTEELLRVTPQDVCRWMNYRAYGDPAPTPDMEPNFARATTLDYDKKAISSFMPLRNRAWHAAALEGNPTRCGAVNKIVERVRRHDVQHATEQHDAGESESSTVGRDADDNQPAQARETEAVQSEPAAAEQRPSEGDEYTRREFAALREELSTLKSFVGDVLREVVQSQNQMQTTFQRLSYMLETLEGSQAQQRPRILPNPGAHTPAAPPRPQDPQPTGLPRELEEVDMRPAALMNRPKTLAELWQEYAFGCEGNKPACKFTSKERGAVKVSYARRKVFWDTVLRLVRAGDTSDEAIERIRAAYGQDLSVTNILHSLRADKRTGGHPSLRTKRRRLTADE